MLCVVDFVPYSPGISCKALSHRAPSGRNLRQLSAKSCGEDCLFISAQNMAVAPGMSACLSRRPVVSSNRLNHMPVVLASSHMRKSKLRACARMHHPLNP